MNANMEHTLYRKLPVVAGLNKVQGFDPCKFMRKTVSEQTKQEIFYLDLKFKKLWFRLACPKGRIKTTALKITEQLAIIEAKVYFDRNDKEPAASFISQRNARDIPGTLYIETAQYAAVDQALVDAGFGLQFADMGIPADAEQYDAGIPATSVNAAKEATGTEKVTQAAVPREKAGTRTAIQTEPALETAAVQTEPALENSVVQTEPALETAEVQMAAVVQERQSAADNPEAAPITPAMAQEAVQKTASAQTPIQAAVAQRETVPAEAISTQTDTAQTPAEELVENETAAGYSADMEVDDICRLMTIEEAENYIVDTGTCKGWTLAQVAQKRAASLRFYLNGYQGDNNILRAGARLLLEQMQMAG